jgi:hypothetical protein
MQLSKNLSLAEMISSDSAKRNGISNYPTEEHIKNLVGWALNIFQPLRDHLGVAVNMSSGYRSFLLNKFIKGSKTTQHSKGEAGDIDMDGSEVTNAEVFFWIKDNLNFDQLIWEFGTVENPAWVHVSYSSSGKQRNQVLIAKKINGKRIYEIYK